jgi:two-component system heavy metal sensor histidine kinase CusS
MWRKKETDTAPTHSWSLAARLSAWYAASAFLLLLVATGFLYWTLTKGFDREDDQYLTEKINVLRTLLGDRKGNARTIEWEVQGEAFTRPSAAVLSRVVSGEGAVVLETSGMSRELPPAVFPAQKEPGSGVEIQSGGKTFRVMSAYVASNSPQTETYHVQVAVDLTHEKNLLASYRKQLWLVLGLGLLVCVFVGYRIGQHGIRPVQEIGATMQHIGGTTLNRRVDAAQLPSELSALGAAFNEMLDRLEDAFGRLSRFSSDIAHELRTPINNLRGEVEVALAKPRPVEEHREILSSLLEEFVRLSRLIDSLLFLARSENPQTEIRRDQLFVDNELGTIRDFYEAAASESGALLTIEAQEGITALLDRTLFQRAVANLVENALTHTPAGGSVALSAAQTNGELLVTVSDTGSGIPPEHLAHVFDRFYRVDPARAKNRGSAGLGLAIVKSIASLHGGSVRIASKPGRGTQVTLVFPCSQQMTKS